MLVIPAIDLKDGEVVRLYKGDYKSKTVYSKNPEKVAKKFQELGAKYIHIVDLDGAKIGNCMNFNAIKKIRNSINIPIEIGGGIRTKETIKLYLEKLKIDRVVLGTIVIENFSFLKDIIKEFGAEKIVVSVDVKNGDVMTSGWEENSKINYIDFIRKLENAGVKYIEVTDISKDGTLEGPNFDMYEEIKQNTNINLVVSGGIKNFDNIEALKKNDYYGCIVGKAYYEGKIKLKEVL